MSRISDPVLSMVESTCSVCGTRDHATQVAVGEDFEYRTSDDSFHVYRCRACDTLFLHPRPARSELGRIYPERYHAYQFTEEEFGLSYAVRRRLESRRLLSWCRSVPAGGSIVDIGAGDGFHLDILKEQGDPTWRLVAVEPDIKAASAATARGFEVHSGFVEELGLDGDQFDFAMMIMVIEHVDDPSGVLGEVHRLLARGGRVGIVTDNTRSVDARFGRARHWGGYHFPRHFNLYSERSLGLLAAKSGFEVEALSTMMSPVNWTYTVHNRLVDRNAPERLRQLFTLKSPLAMVGFTLLDGMAVALRRGALLRAVLRKP